jgi:hypothetical protein
MVSTGFGQPFLLVGFKARALLLKNLFRPAPVSFRKAATRIRQAFAIMDVTDKDSAADTF